ncbi:hypothetical protein [Streptomyces sp. NPDC059533]|uniref:hypothetical protein n=1 Tax=unclassified Streptomyces TaxID=2593676 RepID=UPI003649A7E3
MTPVLCKVAWDHPVTVAAYKQLALRRSAWLGVVLAPTVISMVCTWSGLLPEAHGVLVTAAAATFPFLPVVFLTYRYKRRVVSVLQNYPWRELEGRHLLQTPSLIAVRFSEDFTPTFRMTPFPIRLTCEDREGEARIWFAGDPRYGGVASAVGGQSLVRVVSDTAPLDGWAATDGDDRLARKTGLARRSGKGTWM